METHSVLLVEDDLRLAELVREYLSQHEFEVSVEHRGDRAAQRAQEPWGLIILDLMLPGMDGLELCRSLREHYTGPLMMLTAKGSDIDQVVGLELGADDYVVKPVEPRVLLARVRALLRRYRTTEPAPTQVSTGEFTINRAIQQASLRGVDLHLTTQEFDLLWLLASQAGQVFSRDEIYRQLRGMEYDGIDRTVDVCISHLRKKLGDDGDQPQLIKTVWGKGYLFAADNPQ
jgi:DNA-binding response OmpR family regulator